MVSTSRSGAWDLVRVLAEDTRRRVFDVVRAAGAPLTRDEVAEQSGLNRRLVTFHLDRLVAANLLVTDFARPPGKAGGPGAGRPSKRYAAAPVELDVSLPPRNYDLVARILAAGITASAGDAAAGACEAARTTGHEAGERARVRPGAGVRARAAALRRVLTDLDYEPRDGSGNGREAATITLRNCPFRSVADLAPELICGLNHALVEGLVDGLDARPAEVQLTPNPPCCCVTIRIH